MMSCFQSRLAMGYILALLWYVGYLLLPHLTSSCYSNNFAYSFYCKEQTWAEMVRYWSSASSKLSSTFQMDSKRPKDDQRRLGSFQIWKEIIFILHHLYMLSMGLQHIHLVKNSTIAIQDKLYYIYTYFFKFFL